MGLDRAATLSDDPTMTDEHEAQTLSNLDKIASMTDEEVRRAYLKCEGQCGDLGTMLWRLPAKTVRLTSKYDLV